MEHQQQQQQHAQHSQQPSGHPGMGHHEEPKKEDDPAYVQHGKDFASGYAKEMGKQTAEDQYDVMKEKMNEVPEDSILRKIFPCFFSSTPTPPQGHQA